MNPAEEVSPLEAVGATACLRCLFVGDKICPSQYFLISSSQTFPNRTDIFYSCNDPVLFVQFGASAKSEPLVASIPLFSACGSSRLCSLAASSVFRCFWLVPSLQQPLARPPKTRVRADDVVAICRRPGLCPAPGLAGGQNLPPAAK